MVPWYSAAGITSAYRKGYSRRAGVNNEAAGASQIPYTLRRAIKFQRPPIHCKRMSSLRFRIRIAKVLQN